LTITITQPKRESLASIEARIFAHTVSTIKQSKRESLKSIEARIGTLSNPGKMPGFGTSIPAHLCNVGGKLRLVPGSVCWDCYAFKGRYRQSNVQKALLKRYQALTLPTWVDDMSELINRKCVDAKRFFRWYDSGDVQNLAHLVNIIAVCNRTPNVSHWLPTREYKIVQTFLANGGIIPPNLVIRLSSHMVDSPAPTGYGLPTSRVETITTSDSGHGCPARFQDNECGDCRACWNPEVLKVSYYKH
jgi:hypothetical protein